MLREKLGRLREWLGVTVVTAPLALLLLFAVVTFTDAPFWVALAVFLVVGGLLPVVYEDYMTGDEPSAR